MPQIQVIDREDPARNPVNAFQEQLRQQQETVSNVQYKMAQVQYQRDLAKLEAKKAVTEESKAKQEQEAKEWEQTFVLLQQAEKASKSQGGGYNKDMWNKLTSQWVLEAPPGIGKKLSMLAKAGPQGMQDPKADYQAASADMMNQFAGGGASPQGQQPGMQSSRAGAVGGMIPKGVSFGPSGASMDFANPEAEAAITRAREAATPYTETEAGVMSKVENMPVIVDELIDMLGDTTDTTKDPKAESRKHVYAGLGVPLGASRISAFGEEGVINALKKGMTRGAGRQAGLKLQALKLMLFGEGGKQLTAGERQVAGALLNPAYKNEDDWVKDLKTFKKLLLDKGKYMQKGGTNTPTSANEFGGMSDDELRKIAGGQ